MDQAPTQLSLEEVSMCAGHEIHEVLKEVHYNSALIVGEPQGNLGL